MGHRSVRFSMLVLMVGVMAAPAARPQDATGPARAAALAAAKKAASNLKGTLLARVKRAMKQGGATGAVQVCSQQALELTAKVARDHGVRLGRTATRLRNPENAPPAWMKPILAKEGGLKGPQVVELPTGYGVALPIKTAKACLRCHGDEGSLDPKLRAKLKELYPDDAATGFKQGDLRGWVWVETPGDGSAPKGAP